MVSTTTLTNILLLTFCITKSYQNPVPATPKQLFKRYGNALEAVFGIGIRLQVLLDDPSTPNTKNFLVSPLSVALLMSQLMLGADHEFRDELYDLLSLPKINDHKHSFIQHFGKRKNNTYHIPYAKFHSQMGTLLRDLEENVLSRSFTLNCSNALFVNSDLELNDEFVHNLQIYETEVESANFSSDPVGSQEIINDWVATKTNDVIKTILPSPLPKTASAVFLNALYFLGDWETPFSNEINTIDYFHTDKDNKVKVTYMSGIFKNIRYAESSELGCRMIALPYKNNELSMYFLLPNENNGEEYDIRKFANKLKVNETLEFVNQDEKRKVAVLLPKLQLSSSLSILEPLQKYRIYRKQYDNQIEGAENKTVLDILDERIDRFSLFNTTERTELVLTEALRGEELKITNVIQEVTLTVDEKGTEAAAVSASIVNYMGGTQNFRLNRPFVFFIRHELTQATLFWGTIVDPSQN